MKKVYWIVSMSLLFLFVGGFIGIATERACASSVAEVIVGGDWIEWEPKVANDGLVLTVSGPGTAYFRETFPPGSIPAFEMVDNYGNMFPDGPCKYELTVIQVVAPDVREDLIEARESGDLDALEELSSTLNLSYQPSVQSGSFVIQDGTIIFNETTLSISGDRDWQEGVFAVMDIGHADDVYINGSLCVGFDCVDNESFGFDTIRLKENNLRILFDDTSSSASFPNNDWRIVINDTTDGGGNYFGIEDATAGRSVFRMEAGAPASSLYIDDYGRVGLGTSTPAVELHVKDGDTPTVRLEQDGTYGWTPQTWDLAGNESNFFIRDVTNGSRLPLRIQPGTPSSTLSLRSDGKVGIGTWSPEATLEVERSDNTAQIKVEDTGNQSFPQTLFLLKNNGSVRFDLEDTAQAVTWVFQNHLGKFAVTKAGTGVREMELDQDGNLVLQGTLTVRAGEGDEATYPDYVFEKDYPLMPLSELESFIKEKKHLPKVSSAKELASKGLNMTEMQLTLLEKVEELTLYILAQQRTINNLEARLEAIQPKEEVEKKP
ncbi:MAG: hypothetical protein SV686_09740 [Thermodesulfobacteriota bacterium]|nr:hypothetical protein [Thermodesulfobacteriota bacterium]